jgi:hypothetical protein
MPYYWYLTIARGAGVGVGGECSTYAVVALEGSNENFDTYRRPA